MIMIGLDERFPDDDATVLAWHSGITALKAAAPGRDDSPMRGVGLRSREHARTTPLDLHPALLRILN